MEHHTKSMQALAAELGARPKLDDQKTYRNRQAHSAGLRGSGCGNHQLPVIPVKNHQPRITDTR